MMQASRSYTAPLQKIGCDSKNGYCARSHVCKRSGKTLYYHLPWPKAVAHVRRCHVRSRDYNAAWQLRDQDPVKKEARGLAVVIGGGVAGLASALGLAKWGMSVQVLLQTPSRNKDVTYIRMTMICPF